MELRASHYANQIQELIDRGIALDTTSLDMALSYPLSCASPGYEKRIH